MRGLKASLLTIIALAVVAAPAQAITTNKRALEASVTSTKAGKSTGMNLRLITTTTDGLTPDAGAHDDILLPKGTVYNGSALPSCDPDTLVSQGPAGCPKKSIVGGGNILGLVRNGCGNPPRSELTGALLQTVDLTIVNGKNGRGLLAYLKNPVIGATYIDIAILKAPSPYGLKFTFNVPDLLLQPLPNVCISLADVKININKATVTLKQRVKGKTRTTHPGLIQNGPCPKNRKWPFKDAVNFVSGQKTPGTTQVSRVFTQKTSGSATVRCSK